MIEYVTLSTSFDGRSYEEMVKALNHNIHYPVQLCGSCGHAHIAFYNMKNCPFCDGTGLEYIQVFRMDRSGNEIYQMNMKHIPASPGKYFHDYIVPGRDGWKWTGHETARRGREWVKRLKSR